MMQVTNTRERRVSLVIKLSDIVTGGTIAGGRDISVVSGDGLISPVAKPDGYFVFTGYGPERVRVTSKAYRDALIRADDHTGSVLRFALIPRIISGRTVTAPEDAYIGFSGNGAGYALAEALGEASRDILLRKEDFCDITDLYHVLVAPDGANEAIYISKSLGGGRYSLDAPPGRAYQTRGTRLIALHRTAGGTVPVPPCADTLYVMSGGRIYAESLEGL